MGSTQQTARNNFFPLKSDSTEIDLSAPAGSKNSLGAGSVCDIRPTTCDDVVEAMDEGGPGIPTP